MMQTSPQEKVRGGFISVTATPTSNITTIYTVGSHSYSLDCNPACQNHQSMHIMSSSTSHSPSDIHSYQLQKARTDNYSPPFLWGHHSYAVGSWVQPNKHKPLCCAILNKLQSLVLVVLVAIEMDSTQICLPRSNRTT